MGQAEILTNLGEGLYQVRIKRSADYAQAHIDAAQAGIDKITPIRDAKQAEIDEAMEEINAALEEAWAEWEKRLEFIEEWEAAKLATMAASSHDDYGLLVDTNAQRGANILTYDNGIRLVGMDHAQWLWDFANTNGIEAVTWEIAHGQGEHHRAECAALFEYMDSFGENVIIVEDMADRMREVVGMFMASPGHAKNIQDPKFTHCGIAVYIGSNGVGVAVQLFVGIYSQLMEDQLKLIGEIMANKREIDAVQRKNDLLTMDITSLEARIARLTELLAELTTDIREVWCADYTDNIESGVMPTCDIHGQPGHIILQPTYREPVQEVAEGEMQTEFNCLPAGAWLPIPVMTPAQAAFNWAILPGWQKWRPTYRVGEIVELDANADTCSVILDGAWSVAQQLHINQGTGRLDDVPIEYMDCNAGAFEVGDRVVVEFQNQKWEEPVVIGFETEPQECGGFCVRALVTSYEFYQISHPDYPDWNTDRDTVIFEFDERMTEVRKMIRHSRLAREFYNDGVFSGTIRTRYTAHTKDRAFFTKTDASTRFRHRHGGGGWRADFYGFIICGTNPDWVIEYPVLEKTGEQDIDGNDIYDWIPGSRGRLGECVVGEDGFLYIRAIAPQQNPYILKYTLDGDFVEDFEVPLINQDMHFNTFWWIEWHDNKIYMGMNFQPYSNTYLVVDLIFKTTQEINLPYETIEAGATYHATTYNREHMYYVSGGYTRPDDWWYDPKIVGSSLEGAICTTVDLKPIHMESMTSIPVDVDHPNPCVYFNDGLGKVFIYDMEDPAFQTCELVHSSTVEVTPLALPLMSGNGIVAAINDIWAVNMSLKFPPEG